MQSQTDFHPVHRCEDGLFNAQSGKKINIHSPSPDMINIRDIAGALSKICRFGGQINTFYSVAQHSVLVAAIVPDEFKKEALLHDAAEAYLGDVIKPLKVILGDAYAKLEDRFDGVIAEKFGLNWTEESYRAVKEADMKVLELEHEAFQKGNNEPLVLELMKHDLYLGDVAWGAWLPKEAKPLFMATYHDIFNL